MADIRNDNLVSLDEGYFEVAPGEPDVRGWDVVTADQRKIGEVDDLLADPQALKVRYFIVDFDKDVVGSTADRRARIPISRARLHEREKKVVLDVAAANIANFESAERLPVRDDQVRLTRGAEELRIGKRPVQAGEVAVKKHVETERVRQPVTRRGEEVEIERRPVTAGAPSRDSQIRGQEIRVPVTEEEAVIEKRPVTKEEVIISKHPTEVQDTVETDIRKERIDVERHGDVRAHEKNRERNR
jgi:uncharacterized protein (TIGR02271 family)